MRLNHRELKTFLLFFLAGVIGLSGAVYVATAFLKPARAQRPPTPTTAVPKGQLPPLAAPVVTAPPAVPQSAPPAAAPPPTLGADPNLALPPIDELSEKPQMPVSPPATGKSLLEGIIEDFNYEVSGRRDPFLPYTSPKSVAVNEEEEIISPLQRFDLDQLKLIGIIWDIKKPKAMFLDPQGKGYIVGKLDKVGRNRGYIAEIREGEVIILERFVGDGRSTFQTKAVRLERE